MNNITIAITGHRDLLESDKPIITQKLRKLYADLRAKYGQGIRLYSALAPGADLWAAECLDPADELVYVQTMPPESHAKYTYDGYKVGDYPEEKEFKTKYEFEESKKSYEERLKVFQDRIQPFEELVKNRKFESISLVDNTLDYSLEDARNKQYIQLAEYLCLNCTELIALWDGIDGGGVGGTSDVVRMFHSGKTRAGNKLLLPQKGRTLYHLPAKRTKNLNPIDRKFDANYSLINGWNIHQYEHTSYSFFRAVSRKLNKYSNWMTTGILFFGGLTAKNILYSTSRYEDWWAELSLLTLFITAAFTYKKWEKHGSEILLRFVFPLVIASLVIILGTLGFYQTGTSLGNSFYGAANLITLNSSIFDPNEITNPNIFLKTARLLGGFLAAYAFLLAFALAVGKENLSLLKFWILRRIGRIEFYVILGDGEKALDMVFDSLKSNIRVVFLDGSPNENIYNELKNKNLFYFKGTSTSSIQLHKTYFWQALKVFVLNETDEVNFRTVQEMDQLQKLKAEFKGGDWYIHFSEALFRERIHLLLPERSKQMTCFGLTDNIARRLLQEHPIDRFTLSTKKTHVLLLGFDELGQSILETLLHQAHYLPGFELKMRVYYTSKQSLNLKSFLAKYPFINQTTSYWQNEGNRKIASETFKSIDLEFEELPVSDSELLHKDFWPYKLGQEAILTVYVCVDSGQENVKLLSLLLPRFSHYKAEKKWDLQVFCRYNYPDIDEQEYILENLNSMAKHYQVFCFGNYLEECSIRAFEQGESIKQASEIAYFYNLAYQDEKQEILIEIKNILKNDIEKIDNDLKESVLISTGTTDLKLKKYQKLQSILQLYKLIANKDELVKNRWFLETAMDKEANLRAAENVAVKLRQWEFLNKAELDIESLEKLSFMEHRRWNAEKLMAGWIPFEVENDVWYSNKKAYREQKLHKFITIFDDLPPGEQTKDWSQVMLVISQFSAEK